MNNQFFEVKVKGVKINEDGKRKKVTIPFLVDAVSVSDAETRAIKEVNKTELKEAFVKDAKQSNISEVIHNENGGTWHKCKLNYVSFDEESSKEKRLTNYMLVEAESVKDAYEYLEYHLRDVIVPFSIPSITESPIEDVFHYDANEVPDNLKPVSEVTSDKIEDKTYFIELKDSEFIHGEVDDEPVGRDYPEEETGE